MTREEHLAALRERYSAIRARNGLAPEIPPELDRLLDAMAGEVAAAEEQYRKIADMFLPWFGDPEPPS